MGTAAAVIGQWVCRLVGAVLVLGVLQDLFFTVLFPGSGHGILRRPLARWVWAAFRSVARRLDEPRRRALLAYSGPVQISVPSSPALRRARQALDGHPAGRSGSSGRYRSGP